MPEELRPTEQPVAQVESEVIHHPDGRVEHPRVRYEPRDAHFGWVLAIALAFAVIAAVLHYVVWELVRGYEARQAVLKKSPFPLAPGQADPNQALPPEPRLEQVERLSNAEQEKIADRMAAQERELHRYGRTSEAGYVRIPIERAMNLTAERFKQGGEAKSNTRRDNGLVDDGAPNSGRMLRKEPR